MRRLVALISLVLFSLLIFSYLWWGRFQHFHDLFLAGVYLISAGLVIVNHLYYRDPRRDLGFRLDNLGLASLWFGALTVGGVLAILLAAWQWGDFYFDDWEEIGVYVAWAGVQQYLLQNFLRLRSENLFENPASVRVQSHQHENTDAVTSGPTGKSSPMPALLTGTLFGLYHLPNLAFAALTFFGAFLWTRVFQRVPNFLAAWCSHALLGCLLFLFFKQGLLHQSSVGYPGYRYDYYGGGVVVAAGYDKTGEPFIATLPGHDPKEKALVRVFTIDGQLKSEWEAFPEFYYSGRLSIGELGWGPGDEIVVSPGPGNSNPPLIKIFSQVGEELLTFTVDTLERGWGATVAVTCGHILVCPGPGPNVRPRAVEFNPRGNQTREWQFEDTGFVNSIKASGICENRHTVHTDAPDRLLIWGSEIAVNDSRLGIYNTVSEQVRWIETLPTTFGASVTPMQLEDGVGGWAVAPGPLQGYPPWVKIFTAEGKMVKEFVAFDDDLACGANLASIDVDEDGIDELVVGEGICGSRPPAVRVLKVDGTLLYKWKAY